MRKSVLSVVTATVLLIAGNSWGDSWIAPYTRTYSTPGTGATVTIVPQKNANGRYRGYSTATLTHTVLKKVTTTRFKLLNNPHSAQLFPAREGLFLVTFDTWGRLGYKHTLVIYDSRGKLIRDLELDQLLSAQEIASHVRQTVSSRWWRKAASFSLESATATLTVRFAWGKTLRIDLRRGKILK